MSEETWDFADVPGISEIYLAGTDVKESDGYVIKEILRTGSWDVIPTRSGKINRPLTVVRDGFSDPNEGRIALSELVENFKAGALERVQVPLSDDADDHKNITRLNTGFVQDLWIDDKGEQAKLVAKLKFTEPDILERVLRGTYADVSCGIPWSVTRQGKKFGASLEHVAITNRPFVDQLGPFLAASDKQDADVAHFGDKVEPPNPPAPLPPTPPTPDPPPPPQLAASEIMTSANTYLAKGLMLSSDYTATDVRDRDVLVTNTVAGASWWAPYTFNTTTNGDYKITLSPAPEWVEHEENDDAPADEPAAPPSTSDVDELEAAQRLRGLRLSGRSQTKRKEATMSLDRGELDQLNLSDEQRAAFQQILDERAGLLRQAREAHADRRIQELQELGLAERPGFLKLYRSIFLSDDGGPAVVLSEDGKEKQHLTALQILDQALDALKGSDGKVVLSDQALVSGNDEKPPADAQDEIKSLEERLDEARNALYGPTK